MRVIWQSLGRGLFFLLRPALFVYLRLNARTRVVVQNQGKVLLVKPWLGSGDWDLPGGGLHVSESPRDGVLRETYEETGLSLEKDTISELGLVSGTGVIPYRLHCFASALKYSPKVKKQFIEIIDIKWVPADQLSQYRLNMMAKKCLDLWKNKQ